MSLDDIARLEICTNPEVKTMSKGNTWQKQKMAKHRANNMRLSHGGYARHAPTPDKALGEDRRDGGMKPVHYPEVQPMGPFNAVDPKVHIVTCEVKTARGLSKDVGRVGKGGRTLKSATRAQRETFSQRNLNGIIKGCFATPKNITWEIYTPRV